MKSNKLVRRICWTALGIFMLLNAIAYMHAYRFTHFDDSLEKTQPGENPSFSKKLRLLLSGIDNPRPQNSSIPAQPYETIVLQSNKRIEGWLVKTENSKGTVILFHGYGGEKSSMLDKANLFLQMGYDTFLIDFMGSGGSEGRQTTIGYFEAEEVKTAFDHIKKNREGNLFLFGTSMGSVAVMRAIQEFGLKPSGVNIECPFGTMLETVQARFRTLHIPSFPMANLLVFWGGIQNDFNAFQHNPIDYAKSIDCPVLLLSGEKDERVSPKEIRGIYNNLREPKRLKTYPLAGHENYLNKYKDEWSEDCESFLAESAIRINRTTP